MPGNTSATLKVFLNEASHIGSAAFEGLPNEFVREYFVNFVHEIFYPLMYKFIHRRTETPKIL